MEPFSVFTDRTRMLVRLLKLSIGLQVLAILLDFNQLRVILALSSHQGDTDAINAMMPDADINDQLMGIMGYTQVGLLILTIILFMMWVYRASQNIRAFGAQDVKFTPGWAVGWFFIPVANLWMPFKAMSEIFRASVRPDARKTEPNAPLLGQWWFFWVADLVVGRAAYITNNHAEEIAQLITATYVTILADVVSIPNYYLTMKLVQKIYALQAEAAARVKVVESPPATEPAADPAT
jgi:hypothetical protein